MPAASTLRRVAKKVIQIDKVDSCFKGVADQVNVPSIVNAPDTQVIQSVGTGMIRDLTNIDEALDSTQARTKQRLYLKRLNLKYQLRAGINSSVLEIQRSAYKVRVMVIYQRLVPRNINNRGANIGAGDFPTLANIFFCNQTLSGMDLLSPQSWLNRSGFKIMYDKLHTLYPLWRDTNDPRTITSNQGKSATLGNIRLDLSKLPATEYNSDADGNLGLTKGRLIVVAFSDNINSNANPILMEYSGIVNYDA